MQQVGQKRKVEGKTIDFTMMAWIMEGARRANSLHKEHILYKQNIATLESLKEPSNTSNDDSLNLMVIPGMQRRRSSHSNIPLTKNH